MRFAAPKYEIRRLRGRTRKLRLDGDALACTFQHGRMCVQSTSYLVSFLFIATCEFERRL